MGGPNRPPFFPRKESLLSRSTSVQNDATHDRGGRALGTDSSQVHPVEITSQSWARSFWSLIVTQFQGAFSDNVLKNLVLFLLVSAGLPKEKRDELVPIIGLLFAIPFVLFSMLGGYLADRYSKRTITIATKIMEIAVAVVAFVGLTTRVLPIQLAAIFLISTQAALFGPSKYGLLPEVLPEKKLSWGNGVLELGTFLAIISGTVAGGFLADRFGPAQQSVSGIVLIALAVCGFGTSFGIARVPAANPARKLRINPLSELFQQIKLMRRD